MAEEKRVVVQMSERMKATALLKLLSAQAAQREFVAFVEGCKEGLGLDGDYNLDTAQWQFSPIEKPAAEG